MARRNGELPVWKRWAAALIFATGVALLLLAAYGPSGGAILQKPALGLMGVALYVAVGVNLPQVDWSAILVRVLTALAKGDGNGKGGAE